MIVCIGSTSARKIETVQKLFAQFEKAVTVKGFAATSGVPETPWDRETYEGARNRATFTRQQDPAADYFLGLESGLLERYEHIFEEAWCCVIAKDGTEYYGYSSGLKVPDSITKRMQRENLEHNQVMTAIERELGLPDDTWATYSGQKIARSVSLEEAVRNALLQVFATEKSLYQPKTP
jgi:non-canonical (house-cleaning) NTP pyrophosphatase